MKKQPKYKIGSILKGTYGEMEVIEDFLPSPEELANAPVYIIKDEPQTKITVTLNRDQVEFLKKHAKQLNMPYERMINTILDQYVKKKTAKQ